MPVSSTANTKGRNVEILTDFLSVETRSYDCSAFTTTVAMGEFLNTAVPHGGAATRASTPGLRCVFSEAGRSDLQALSYRKVPVIYRGAFQAKFNLWWDSQAAAMVNATANMAAGTELVATTGTIAASDTLNLHCLENIDSAYAVTGAGTYWVVGYVIAAPTAVGDSVEAYIYDSPRNVILI